MFEYFVLSKSNTAASMLSGINARFSSKLAIAEYHYILKAADRTFTSRTDSLYVPSKSVKVVRPIGKRQGALHLDRFAMRHRVLTPLREVKEK